MAWFNFDLQDGKGHIGFNLKDDHADRFMAFMEECQSWKQRALEAEALIKGFPEADDGTPIVYDTHEVDEVTHALTGDEGEDDSLTVLNQLARYVQNVWPGKNARDVLLEYEQALMDLNAE